MLKGVSFRIINKVAILLIATLLICKQGNCYNDVSTISQYVKVWGLLKYKHPSSIRTNWDTLFIHHINDLTNKTYSLNEVINQLLKNVEVGNKKYLLDNNKSTLPSWFTKLNTHGVSESNIEKLEYLWSIKNATGIKYWYYKELGTYRLNKYFKPDGFLVNKEDALLGVAKVWNVIEYFCFYKEQLRTNWDSTLDTVVPKIIYSTNRREINHKYRMCIKFMEAQLNDCHTLVGMDNYFDYHMLGAYKPPFTIFIVNNFAIINSIDTNDTQLKGIHIGDTIMKINGQKIEVIIDSLLPYIPCRYQNAIQAQLANMLLRGKKDSLNSYVINNNTFILKNTAYYLERFKTDMPSYKINDSLAYINFKFIKNRRAFKKIIKQFNYPQYYIFNYENTRLDLAFLIQYFTTKNYTFIARYTPNFKALGAFKKRNFSTIIFFPFVYRKVPYKAIFIKTNSHIMSYSEFVTMALQANKNVYTIGDTSAAALSEIRKMYLPGNIGFVFTANAAYYPNESTQHRSYVKIDYSLPETTDESVLIEYVKKIINNDLGTNFIRKE